MVEGGIPQQEKYAQAGLTTLNVDSVRLHASELVERNTWPRDRLTTYQHERLQHALAHAVAASPYYMETLGKLVAQGTALSAFPILTKRELMANFDQIVTDKRLTRALIEQHLESQQAGSLLLGEYLVAATGGTSGERGVFVYNRQAWLSVTANIVRFLGTLGVLPNTRSIGIGAPSPIHLSNRFYAELRAGRPGAPALDVTMPVEHVVEALNSYQPEALTTYPSFMRVLVHEQKAGRLRISPRFFRSGAEALTAEVKELVRGVWNVPVFNGYASTEVGVMAQECEHQSGLHLAEDLSVYEVVDEQNRPLPAGVPGAKILITTLTNPTLPLVRYELTDVVALASGTCRCGLPFTRLSSIEGRREEVLRFPRDGGGVIEVHAIRLHSPLIGMEGLRQFQLAQLPDGLQVSICIRPELDSEAMRLKTERTIQKVLEKLGVAPVKIDVKVVDEIARVGSGAKMKLVAKARQN